MAFGTSLEEVDTSLGKKNAQLKKIGVYGLIALNMGVVFSILVFTSILWPKAFFFSALSLPFFLTRACLEIAQVHKALILADRTTFSFVRTLTMPLLLLVDVFLGYPHPRLVETDKLVTHLASCLI